jgi:D-alanyl-lipoteichoic acid acyltransferase DltB (MBOAT superfamily)
MGAVLFSSLEFLLLFLPLTLVVAWRLRGQPLLRWIAFTSVVFYAFAGHWWFIVPMLATTVVDYWVAILIEREARPRARRWLLALSLTGNSACSPTSSNGLMVRTVEQGPWPPASRPGRLLPLVRVEMPAGIAFYTFRRPRTS